MQPPSDRTRRRRTCSRRRHVLRVKQRRGERRRAALLLPGAAAPAIVRQLFHRRRTLHARARRPRQPAGRGARRRRRRRPGLRGRAGRQRSGGDAHAGRTLHGATRRAQPGGADAGAVRSPRRKGHLAAAAAEKPRRTASGAERECLRRSNGQLSSRQSRSDADSLSAPDASCRVIYVLADGAGRARRGTAWRGCRRLRARRCEVARFASV